MANVSSTRLRFISSSSSEGLELIVNTLPFKIEIKSIQPQGKGWIVWFVLPDKIEDKDFVVIVDRIKKRIGKK